MSLGAQERVHEEALWNIRIERSKEILRNLVETHHAEGLPIDSEGRVAANYDEHFRAGIRAQELEQDGTQFEILIAGLFQKFLGDSFIVSRSSHQDDRRGFDTILVHRQSGDVVCAFDEIVQSSKGDQGLSADQRKEGKEHQAIEQNHKGGAKLIHGLHREGKSFAIAPVEGVPVYVISTTSEKLERGLLEYTSTGDSTFFERQLFFNNFIRQLQHQNTSLLNDSRVPKELKEKITAFRDRLAEAKGLNTRRMSDMER